MNDDDAGDDKDLGFIFLTVLVTLIAGVGYLWTSDYFAYNYQRISSAQNDCINNLRQIDGAKEQWAIENKKSTNSVVSASDITPYLKNGIPMCPHGGTYTLNVIGIDATCSIGKSEGHVLP